MESVQEKLNTSGKTKLTQLLLEKEKCLDVKREFGFEYM
jgi:hypothetical protein